MKTSISVLQSEPNNLKWWTWNEFCDDCEKQTRTAGNFSVSWTPSIEKKDYCTDCLDKRLGGVNMDWFMAD